MRSGVKASRRVALCLNPRLFKVSWTLQIVWRGRRHLHFSTTVLFFHSTCITLPLDLYLDHNLTNFYPQPPNTKLSARSPKMPISKKDRISREHKKADAAGTRVPVNPNGTPVKPAKAKVICAFCRKDLVRFLLFTWQPSLLTPTNNPQDAANTKILEQHSTTHADTWTKEKCFPTIQWS